MKITMIRLSHRDVDKRKMFVQLNHDPVAARPAPDAVIALIRIHVIFCDEVYLTVVVRVDAG